MKKLIFISCILLSCIIMVSTSSCKKSENKSRQKTEIESEIKSDKQIEIEEILCKPGNYWFLYELIDTTGNNDMALDKYIALMDCWKFLPEYEFERGFWSPISQDVDSLYRHIIYGGCGTIMEGEDPEALEAAYGTKWKFIDKYNVLDFNDGVWKFTRIDHDTIYMKDRYGTRAIFINWGENVKKVKREIPFNEKDTITLKDPIINRDSP